MRSVEGKNGHAKIRTAFPFQRSQLLRCDDGFSAHVTCDTLRCLCELLLALVLFSTL